MSGIEYRSQSGWIVVGCEDEGKLKVTRKERKKNYGISEFLLFLYFYIYFYFFLRKVSPLKKILRL